LFVRTDDQPETIQERLRVFHEQTAPVREFFEGRHILHHVDGQLSPEDVYAKIVEGIDLPKVEA
jgi:adenylate kinase